MKLKIILVFTLCYKMVFSQLGGDYFESSHITFKKITKNNVLLYADGWSSSKKTVNRRQCPLLVNYEYFHLKEKNKKNLKNYEFKKSGIFVDGYQFKESEMDNSFHNLCYIYNNEIMILKVRKNLKGVYLIIKEIKFEKGVFEIDFKKIAKKFIYKNKEVPKFPDRQIIINTFPF